MSREDWLDYFEAINGRTASEEEIAQALRNGEFQEDTVVIADSDILDIVEEVEEPHVETKVQEPTVQQPIVVSKNKSNGQQEYTNTGQQQSFNTNPNPSFNQSQTTEQAKVIARGFWSWFIANLKAPSASVYSHKYNGYIAFVLISLFQSLALFMYARQAVGVGTNFINGLSNAFRGNTYQNPVGFQVFFTIFIGILLFVFSFILSIFVTKKVLYKDDAVTFSKSFDLFGKFSSLTIIFAAVAAVGALLNIITLSALTLYISYILLFSVNCYIIIKSKNTSSMDSFYRSLLAGLLSGVIICIFIYIDFSLLKNYITNLIPSFF